MSEYINKYIDHIGFNDLQIRENSILFRRKQSFMSACRQISFNLDSGDLDRIQNSLCFLRDLYLSRWLTKKSKQQIMKAIEQSEIYRKLAKGLYSGIESIRSDCIYTIGKLSNKKHFNSLNKAFYNLYSKSHPLHINSVFFECIWLSRRDQTRMLKRLIHSENFLFRWSSLSLDNCINFDSPKIRKLYLPLQSDPIDVIRNEFIEKFNNSTAKCDLDFETAAIYVGNIRFYSNEEFANLDYLECAFKFCINNAATIRGEISKSRKRNDDSCMPWTGFAESIKKSYIESGFKIY